jgi:precorrin-2 dehydrogenase/sirohydrochlorin ferrochelatase
MMTPLFVDLSTKRVVIFGGGDVAARKVAFFASEADVLVVSRSFSKPITALPVCRVEMDISQASDAEIKHILSGAFIAVAALPDRKQNDRIGRICKRSNILFNNASGEKGDIIIPSVIRKNHYRVAISTDGKSPLVSRFIRSHLETKFSHLDNMIVLQDMLRKKLVAIEPSQKRRQEILSEVFNDKKIWESLGRSQEEAEDIVTRRYLHG